MAESFSVTRRFFDDKNYPRGFSRHGDYTIKESQVLEQYGQAFKALESGEREPVTKEEKTLLHSAVVSVQQKPFLRKHGLSIVHVSRRLNVFIRYQV